MAKNIMIQGTMSNAGKSLIAAALCRIFTQDGFKTAPFKSQNMALNSYITANGGEMGRAQAVQAEAAKVVPNVYMNPILLKPTTDVGSQIIVNGKVFANMKASEYFRKKREFIPKIMSAYKALEREYDVIVIEGAGSPAELNLKSDDIVNMGLAKMVDAPVILVGDIDRGGIFAQLYGTVALLEEHERKRIKATLVNKFRGDKAIFEPATKMLEELCNVPVCGVVPYADVDIDDEDSLSERFNNSKTGGYIDIAVIRLPKISNFTDFMPFERAENVTLRYITKPSELKNPDMIIIPGTKNTIADLCWIRQNGLETAIKRKASTGILIFGICGGFQMLGERICDPDKTETAEINEICGMGLIKTDTVFGGEKVQKQTCGKFGKICGMLSGLSGKEYRGYEIHHGRNGEIPPMVSGSSNVYGSYIHGIFDNSDICTEILKAVGTQKGLDFSEIQRFESVDIEKYKEEQYDKLANIVRENIDMKLIYRILNREV